MVAFAVTFVFGISFVDINCLPEALVQTGVSSMPGPKKGPVLLHKKLSVENLEIKKKSTRK